MKMTLAALGTLALALCAITGAAVVLGADQPQSSCTTALALPSSKSGSWLATAYGPPWGGIEGDGITATRLNLTAGQPALEVAVDPHVIPLGSYLYITPNPFGTHRAFYAGDTGGAITGRHVDIYDWRGRANQDAWGTRTVTVTPAPNPHASNLLDSSPPNPPPEINPTSCTTSINDENIELAPGQTAHIQPDGTASAPRQAPIPVKLAIAAGNLIHTRSYPEPDQHYGTLAKLWPAYDCSGATSFVLYAAGLMSPEALNSTGLESYGQPGPGRWITVYANSTHAWIVVAGIALDTADYGGPPIPQGTGPRWRPEPVVNLTDGTPYITRHPSGL